MHPTEPPLSRNRYLTVEETAVILNCSRRSVFNLLKKGLPSVKLPGLGRRVLGDKLDGWLLSGAANKPAKCRVKPQVKKIVKESTQAEDQLILSGSLLE